MSDKSKVVPYANLAPAVKRATLLPLVGITYCMVAGGPFGLEDLVHDSGYLYAVLILIITPILWSFPVTLMVSELSAAMPDEGGYYVWVRRAMGPFWGFQEAWLSFAASIFDMALYPTLFITYLARLWPAAGEGKLSTLIGIGLIVLCVGINLAGIRSVGAGSLVMTLAVLSPFAVMIVVALLSPAHPAATPAAPVKPSLLLGGILVAMWNYMGWDNVSTIAGEVHRPQRTYPLAMLISVLLVAATYILPVAAVSRAGIAPESWDTGSWVDVGRTIGSARGPHFGAVLAIAVTAGGMISAFSMFNALVLSYSRVPIAMAADGFLPRIMGRRNRTGVPWVAVLVCAVGWGMCLKLGFENLLLLDTLLYGLSLVLEFAALVALRLREPGLARPYKVPGGLVGCILISLGPIPLLVAAFFQLLSKDGAKNALICSVGAVVLGFVLYYVAVAVNPRLRRNRTQVGFCPICGYDLRATLGRCPACAAGAEMVD